MRLSTGHQKAFARRVAPRDAHEQGVVHDVQLGEQQGVVVDGHREEVLVLLPREEASMGRVLWTASLPTKSVNQKEIQAIHLTTKEIGQRHVQTSFPEQR